MTRIKHYDIHGIISLKLILEDTAFNNSSIDEPFSFFETNSTDAPKITLIMNSKNKSSDVHQSVFRDYRISKNYIAFSKKTGGSIFNVEITGVEEDNLVVHFNWIKRSIKDRLLPNYFPQLFIIEPLIEFLLLRKGYILLPAAGISKGSSAILLCGRSGSMKTPLTIEMLKNQNCSLLGDDKVIVNNEAVYSFPKNLHLFNYLFLKKNTISEFNPLLQKILCLLSSNDKKFDFKIKRKDKVQSLVFLVKERQLHVDFKIHSLSEDIAFEMLINNNIAESSVSNVIAEALLAYSYIHKDFTIPSFQTASMIIRALVQGCDKIVVVFIPDTCDQNMIGLLAEKFVP